MKKFIFTFLSVIAVAVSASAQQKIFRPTTKYAQIGNDIYKVYHSPNSYCITNASNKDRGPELLYTDGTSAYGHDTDDKEIVYPEDEIHDIFRSVFTPSELMRMQKDWISINMTVSPEGDIWELYFSMRAVEQLMDLPVERFAALEKELKKLKLQVGPITRSLRFNWVSYQLHLSEIPLDLPPIRPDPGIAKKTES